MSKESPRGPLCVKCFNKIHFLISPRGKTVYWIPVERDMVTFDSISNDYLFSQTGETVARESAPENFAGYAPHRCPSSRPLSGQSPKPVEPN